MALRCHVKATKIYNIISWMEKYCYGNSWFVPVRKFNYKKDWFAVVFVPIDVATEGYYKEMQYSHSS